MGEGTRRERYAARLSQLKSERATWEPTWRDIAENICPYRIVMDPKERNRGDKKESKIINSTPVQALKTLAAGMMAGITSPARKWFSLTTADRELAEVPAVKTYLDQCEERLSTALQQSNFYPSLANGTYLDMGSIGQSAMFQEDGRPGELHFTSMPIGEYSLDSNAQGEVDVCYRELYMTTRQMVQKFGLAKLSLQVQQAYDRGDYLKGFIVVHAIQPNDEYEHGRLGPRGMAFSSCWWEQSDERLHQFIREEGYETFPILAPRWSVRPGDTYGRGPGWEARGDARALQHKEKNLAKMLDKLVDPPMRASGTIKRMSLLPGDYTAMPRNGTGVYEPAIETAPLAAAMERLMEHIARDERRLQAAMYSDLWRRLIDDERSQRATATEIEGMRDEIMMMLGPLLENLDNDLLEPCIERAFTQLDRADMLPMPPPELEGQPVKIKFISIMHQMQMAQSLNGIRTLVIETTRLSQVDAHAIDKLNGDVIVDEIGRSTGVRPDAIRSDEEVQKIRDARAKQEEAQQNGAAMVAASQGAKNLGQTDPQKLSDVMSMISPVAAGQGGALATIGSG